jgi:protein SCO1/2
VIGCATLTLMRPLLRHVPDPPPVLGQVPPFTLTDASGKRFGSADLRGQVVIASVFFTRCPSICPLLMRRMGQLQERLGREGEAGIRLLSVTVDPGHDTPERLRQYGASTGVDPARWTLLTGSPAQVRALVEGGFKVAAGEAATAGGILDIAHSGKFVLLDGRGRIRGYYDAEGSGLDEVFHRARHVRDQALN